MRQLDGIERETGQDPDLSIIWLHGLGADATDFLPVIGELDLPCDTRFVFPNAPSRPVTINAGAVMRAWYDITGFRAVSAEDTEGLLQSIAIVRELVRREVDRGMRAGRIVLAGFSQGGAVALHAGLTGEEAVGGIMGLSTYLPAVETLRAEGTIRTDVPVMLAHGTRDPVIPIEIAQGSARLLANQGVAVDWSAYPMGHEVSLEEFRKISGWLGRFRSR